MTRALILFAHGSRSPAWARSLDALAGEFRRHDPTLEVRLAFLELQQPPLGPVIDELVAAGLRHIDVFPAFWASGSHVAVDAPALLDAARERHPGLDVRLLPVISEVRGLNAWLADAVLSMRDTAAPPALIMPATGGGSGDERSSKETDA